MATMTVSEANYIFDIVCTVLQDTTHRHIPLSALRGYDIHQICTAFKLKIANELLILAYKNDSSQQFEEGVRLYDGGPRLLIMRVVPDGQADEILATSAFEPVDPTTIRFNDQRRAREETGASFAEYCKSVGAEDPLYWQKIYTRLDLDYTSTSPQRNDTVSPMPCLEDPCIREHYLGIVFAFFDLLDANAPLIGDENLLPYPKRTILYAIRWVMDHFEGLRETTSDPAILEPCDKLMPTLSCCLTTLARDWHNIEPADAPPIAEINKLRTFPEWALQLKAKYIDDDRASQEAFDVTIQVVKDRVDFEKRHGKSGMRND